jgi:hypothetical protein
MDAAVYYQSGRVGRGRRSESRRKVSRSRSMGARFARAQTRRRAIRGNVLSLVPADSRFKPSVTRSGERETSACIRWQDEWGINVRVHGE